MKSAPYVICGLATATYALLLRASTTTSQAATLRKAIKHVSAGHATLTTLLALYALRPTAQWTAGVGERTEATNALSHAYLDDNTNPLIAARSDLANAITSWETGYLLYDTCALLLDASTRTKSRKIPSAIAQLAKESPVFLAHHVALLSALAYLQTYVSSGREKGLQVIVAFLLMNASNPVLHLRWMYKQRSGSNNRALDATFLVVFALSRFVVVYWVLQRYGQYHGLGPLDAYKRLRRPCQIGTGALIGLNAAWWAVLVWQMMRKSWRKKHNLI